jgi:hypothetical protein
MSFHVCPECGAENTSYHCDECGRIERTPEQIKLDVAIMQRAPRPESDLSRLKAELAEVTRDRDNWRDHCQAISDLFDPLHHNVLPHSALIVARAAKDAHLQVRNDRDSIRAKLAEAEKERDELHAELKRVVDYAIDEVGMPTSTLLGPDAPSRTMRKLHERARLAEAALGEMS